MKKEAGTEEKKERYDVEKEIMRINSELEESVKNGMFSGFEQEPPEEPTEPNPADGTENIHAEA